MADLGASSPDPLVTIGISTFNRVDGTFPAALRSALAQTDPRFEVVVCDNASTDGTEAFMRSQRDARLRYVRHAENIGANGNFNACLHHARGRYFVLLHDDDLLDPDLVARAAATLDHREPGVLLGGVRLIDGAGRSLGTVPPPPADRSAAELFLAWFARRFSFYFCSTLFHTERLRADGGFASPEDLFQDVVAVARLAPRYGYAPIDGTAGSFRKHESNRGNASHALRWARDAEYLLDLLCAEMPADAARLRAAGAPYLTNTCYRYVAAVPSAAERRRLYRDIHERFGRALPPWRFHWHSRRQGLRAAAGRWLRSVGVRRPRRFEP